MKSDITANYFVLHELTVCSALDRIAYYQWEKQDLLMFIKLLQYIDILKLT